MGVGLGIKDGENLTDLKKVESLLFRILTFLTTYSQEPRGRSLDFLNIVASFKFYNYGRVLDC